jgi:hypothetical protein
VVDKTHLPVLRTLAFPAPSPICNFTWKSQVLPAEQVVAKCTLNAYAGSPTRRPHSCKANNTHCLNLLKHTGKRTHDGQLAQMQHRGMGAGYNVTWFRCPGCKLGPTTLAKALDYTNWECDGLDDQTGRTTHNDNKTNSACPRQGDFLKFRKFSMRPMPSQKIKSRA